MTTAEQLAFLDRLSDADLNKMRSDLIPQILRERVAGAREQQYQEYLAEYQAQAKTQGKGV
jgi:hypothetical protein